MPEQPPPSPPPAPPARRRLLFLSYFFPPAEAIASVRGAAFAKWLARAGWEVTVVTPVPSAWRRTEGPADPDAALARIGIRAVRTAHRWGFLAPRHIRSPFEGGVRLRRAVGHRLARAARRAAERLGLPKEAGWRRDVRRAARALPPGGFDLVLATGSPFVSFDLARTLSRRLRCPYVLDYRDLWSENPYAPEASRREIARERRAFAGCAAALAVSPGLAESLASRFGGAAKVHVVTNGYDAEELARVPPRAFGHFAIVYAGRFYPPAIAATPLLSALARLRALGAPEGWRFHHFGRDSAHVASEAARLGLADRVEVHGEVPRSEALSAVRGAGLAAVVTSGSRRGSAAERGVITGKVFEAIGLGTPVVAIAPEGSDLDAVLETAGGGRRFAPDDPEGIAAFVADVMRNGPPPRNRPEEFDWKNRSGALDRILRGVADAEARPS